MGGKGGGGSTGSKPAPVIRSIRNAVSAAPGSFSSSNHWRSSTSSRRGHGDSRMSSARVDCASGTSTAGLEATKGKTRVRGLIDRHVDACGLDYVRLGAVARIIAGALEKQQYRRSTKAGVRKLLVAAIKDGRLKLEDLEQDVKDEIAKAQTP